jgi:hypothetical protein
MFVIGCVNMESRHNTSVPPRSVNAAGAVKMIRINFTAISEQYAGLAITPIQLNKDKIRGCEQLKKLEGNAVSVVLINIIVP